MTDDFAPSSRTTPTRLRERVTYDRGAAYAVIDGALLCHVGFVVDGLPVVLPQLHARIDDTLYLHGSSAARALRSASGGIQVCVTITSVQGLVLARSAFHHSVNYRSVVVHGEAHLVTAAEEKSAVLARFVDAVVPGRSAGVRGANRRELAATSVLALPLEEVSIKQRSGPPVDDDEDLDSEFWAGVLPLTELVPGNPDPAPDLRSGIEVPEHVAGWRASDGKSI